MQIRCGWAARMLSTTGLAAILGFVGALQAGTARAGDYAGSPQVDEFIAELTRDYGFASEQLVSLFQEAERKQSILDAISRPAERVKPWKEYRPIFITDARVARGVDFWRQHEAALARAEQEYGVPAQVIVAIIGVETFYGRNTGNYRVIDALSTLGFDYPPRAPFFRKELREFLLLAREEQVDPLSVTGSYAGAMGLPQFMPSSWARYAIDFDGNGKVDLFDSPADVIGSVANYFKAFGWTPGMPTHYPVRFDPATLDLETLLAPDILPSFTVEAFQAKGAVLEGAALQHPGPLALVELQNAGAPSSYVAGTQNFYVVTRYNWSSYYALAVIELGEAVKAALPER